MQAYYMPKQVATLFCPTVTCTTLACTVTVAAANPDSAEYTLLRSPATVTGGAWSAEYTESVAQALPS